MSENQEYRALQEHLDRQAVGFPRTPTGAEIRFLQQLFTPEEARLALNLSFRPTSIEEIVTELSPENALALLERMTSNGAIGWKRKDGKDFWFLMPVVVGMYEGQDGRPDPEFQRAAEALMQTQEWGTALLAASPSQMRTVPVGIDVPVTQHVASYEQIRAIVESAKGPFVVLPCICREEAAGNGGTCRRTTRTETCLGFGDVGAMVRKRKHGREITREEAVSILRDNEKDGLVFQPSNAREPSFVCSCCGCCCGMLRTQKRLPRPLAFWTASYHAVVDTALCTACGTCADRCQVTAVAVTGSAGHAVVNLDRCIGCGLCVTTCAAEAIRLEKNAAESVPPSSEEELYERIHAGRKSWGETRRDVAKRLFGF